MKNLKKEFCIVKKVKQKFGNQTYLNHPVHLTLFTLKIKKTSELKKFI